MGIKWSEVLATRTTRIHASVIDDLRSLPSHPDPIPFNGGNPAPECVPLRRLGQSIARAWETAPETLYYDESDGFPGLRSFIAERMIQRGVPVSLDEVLITNGSQQGIDLVAKAFLEPGDRVIVEGPTYFGALQTFDVYEAEYITVPMDTDGIIPDLLEQALESTPKPKLIYLIPTFQNPTGVTLTPERRQSVIELSHRYNVPIIEDDPYGELWFHGSDPGPLRALDPDVIYLGTFSKTLAPGIRMGWMTVPRHLHSLFTDAKEGVDIQSDRVLQRGVTAAVQDGWYDSHLNEARAVYRRRCDLLLRCLEAEMPAGVTWTVPDGGFFVWVNLPDGTDADRLLYDCAQIGARYVPGSAFYPDDEPRASLRLGFTTLSDEQIVEGIKRLGRVFRARLG